jgi:hypothetical protein
VIFIVTKDGGGNTTPDLGSSRNLRIIRKEDALLDRFCGFGGVIFVVMTVLKILEASRTQQGNK